MFTLEETKNTAAVNVVALSWRKLDSQLFGPIHLEQYWGSIGKEVCYRSVCRIG
jgi:hypothetical protein